MDDELSGYAEAWLDEDLQAIESGLVHCGHCGSVMTNENLFKGWWQMTCDHCGTSGPRASSKAEAATLALELFP